MTGPRLASLPLSAVLLAASLAAAQALQADAPAPAVPDLAAAAAAGPASTAAYGARCIGAAHDDTAAFQAAIDTGRTVYAPAMGGRCHITRPLVMKTPGQIFGGDGRARTKIVIEPGFAGQGVFVAQTGEPGPVWRDFSVSFVQPDTDDRAKLTRYPPAFYAQSTPRFEMDHMGCYVATACVDMKGNSGGATIADLQMSAFEVGIDIDGSQDTVRIKDPHWWIFEMTKAQAAIFYAQGNSRSIAIKAGRVDGLDLAGGLFFGGLALSFQSNDFAFGTISRSSFDSHSGIEIKSGRLQIDNCSFSASVENAMTIDQAGGALVINSSSFESGAKTSLPLLRLSGGRLSIVGSSFQTNLIDMKTIVQTDGILMLDGNVFGRSPNQNYKTPTLSLEGGRTMAVGNYASDKGVGQGQFADVRNDNPFNRFIGNSTPGWPRYAPLRGQGTYLFN